MIKYFMRIFYKDIADDSLEYFSALFFKYQIINVLCTSFWFVLFILLFVPYIIIVWTCSIELIMQAIIALLCHTIIVGTCYNLFIRFFKEEISSFSYLMALKVYFSLCTSKGKAISIDDFNVIKTNHEKLYNYISTQKCRGYCYAMCFEICQTLKKGSVELIAIKLYHYNEGSESFEDKANVDYEYTFHALYVNNGWAFDPYSVRQFPLDKLHEIFKGKIYKTFSFEEIKYLTYDEFRAENEDDVAEWCKINNCFQKFERRLDN